MFTVCVLQARLSDLEDELELFRPNTRSDSHVLESVLSLRELIKLEKKYKVNGNSNLFYIFYKFWGLSYEHDNQSTCYDHILTLLFLLGFAPISIIFRCLKSQSSRLTAQAPHHTSGKPATATSWNSLKDCLEVCDCAFHSGTDHIEALEIL